MLLLCPSDGTMKKRHHQGEIYYISKLGPKTFMLSKVDSTSVRITSKQHIHNFIIIGFSSNFFSTNSMEQSKWNIIFSL